MPLFGLQVAVGFSFSLEFGLALADLGGQFFQFGLSAIVPPRMSEFEVLLLLLEFAVEALDALELLGLEGKFLSVLGAHFLHFLLEPVLLGDFGEDLVPHGFEVGLQQFGLGLVRLPRIVVVGVAVVEVVLLVAVAAVVAEGLVLEGVETRGVGALSLCQFAREVDDGKLLLLADIQLVQQFVVQLHKFLLQDADLLLMVTALAPLAPLRKYHSR